MNITLNAFNLKKELGLLQFMNKFLKFSNLDKNKIKRLINRIFIDEPWVNYFLNDAHHGLIHGNQVRLSCLKIVAKLNSKENIKLLKEGKKICKNNFHEGALVAIQIAAIFHDCGRFNKDGKIIAKEQKHHHILSAKRANKFCKSINLITTTPFVEDAILCHDFQSKELTPSLNSPKTIIGKIVQTSDQMGWFHPNSIIRTLNYNKAIKIPFYDSKIDLKERLTWRPNKKSKDALTVMLNQLFGPTDVDRFGIEFGRLKIKSYQTKLENNIIKIAEKHHLKKETILLINNFRKFKIII